MENIFKNGTAFLCIKDVYYKSGPPEKIGKQSFTKDKLYYISLNCYLVDDNGYQKNYAWFRDNFVPAPENDRVIAKRPFYGKKSVKKD